MSLPSRTRPRHACPESHVVPDAVTPLTNLAIVVGSVVCAISAVQADPAGDLTGVVLRIRATPTGAEQQPDDGDRDGDPTSAPASSHRDSLRNLPSTIARTAGGPKTGHGRVACGAWTPARKPCPSSTSPPR